MIMSFWKNFKSLKKWKSNLTLVPFVVVFINAIAPLRQTKTSNSKNGNIVESKVFVIYKYLMLFFQFFEKLLNFHWWWWHQRGSNCNNILVVIYWNCLFNLFTSTRMSHKKTSNCKENYFPISINGLSSTQL